MPKNLGSNPQGRQQGRSLTQLQPFHAMNDDIELTGRAPERSVCYRFGGSKRRLITFEPSHEVDKLIRRAKKATGKTQTRIIEECIMARLWPKGSKVPCPVQD